MSESSFPFEQPVAAPVADEGTGRGKAPLLLAGGLVVALGAAGFVLLGGSGAEDDVPVAAPPTASKPVEAPAEAPPVIEVVPVASDEQIGRNPFKARYVKPKEVAAVTTTSSSSGGTLGPGGSTDGSTSGGGAAGGGSTSSGGAGSPAAATTTRSVSLLEVDDDGVATFVVTSSADDKPTPAVVAPGEVFASYFRFINHRTSVGPDDKERDCAKVLVGDALVELCQNESYAVKAS